MVERRRTVRAVARIEVFERGGPAQRVPLYVSGNVSAGGMFLITQDPMEPGTMMKISFSLPEDKHEIKTEGKVIWKRIGKESSDQPPGMGVQFLKIEEEDQKMIREFVYAHMDDHEPEE